ncbi:MAG: site-specific integrase [Alphaproteobacteria bacterium]|nr:site-specific integrase [Alphaproteobacteria bacterium]
MTALPEGQARLINRFLQAQAAEKAAAANSLLAYETDLRLTARQIDANFSDMDAHDLRRLIKGWEAEGLAPRTRARRLSTLRQFMSWMVADGYRTDNPVQFLDSPKLPESLPKSLDEEEVLRLLAAAQKLPPPDDLRMEAALELLYAGGLRISELLGAENPGYIAAKIGADDNRKGRQGTAGTHYRTCAATGAGLAGFS